MDRSFSHKAIPSAKHGERSTGAPLLALLDVEEQDTNETLSAIYKASFRNECVSQFGAEEPDWLA